jgi:hypothetical protein
MGLLQSTFTVFGQGAEIEGHHHSVAALVMLVVFAGDIIFFRWLRQKISRLRSEGALEFCPSDDVNQRTRHGIKLYRHDEEGNVVRNEKGQMIPAKMDGNVHPPIACDFDVHANKHNDAIYFVHGPDGTPLCDNDGNLVRAETVDNAISYEHDKKGNPLMDDDRNYKYSVLSNEGTFAPSARPVPVDAKTPLRQNAMPVPMDDTTLAHRLILLFRYQLATSGEWVGNTDEVSADSLALHDSKHDLKASSRLSVSVSGERVVG